MKNIKLKSLIKETKEYHYKKDAMNDFFKGKLSATELIKISQENFRVEVATVQELQGFLDNKFMQEMMAETHGISTTVLVKKVKELIKKIK